MNVLKHVEASVVWNEKLKTNENNIKMIEQYWTCITTSPCQVAQWQWCPAWSRIPRIQRAGTILADQADQGIFLAMCKMRQGIVSRQSDNRLLLRTGFIFHHLPSSSIIFHPIGSTAKHCSIMLPCHGAKATAFKVDQCNSQIKFQSKNIALYYSKISYNNQGHWTLHKFDQSTSAPGTRVTSASFESGSWSLGLGPLPQTQAPLSPMLSRHYGWLSSAAFAILRNSTFGK